MSHPQAACECEGEGDATVRRDYTARFVARPVDDAESFHSGVQRIVPVGSAPAAAGPSRRSS